MRNWTAWVAGFLFAAALANEGHAQQSSTADVPMRDGVNLKTTIWLPGTGSYPAVLTRGYSPDGLGRNASFWNRNGYAFVSQQGRGNGGEDGSRFFPDDKDGYDCIQWIAQQPWSNGKVAMWGGSYWGATQWRAAVAQPPALKAIIPGFINPEPWKNQYRSHGAIHLKLTSEGRVFPQGKRYSLDEWKSKLLALPLIDMDRQFSGAENRLWRDYISHSTWDDYWKPIGMIDGNKYARIAIPVYLVAGWKDYYAGATFEAFGALTSLRLSPDVRVRIGDHGHSGEPDLQDSLRFLDWHLKGTPTGIQNEAPIKIQVRHGAWKFADRWPLAGTRFTKYYLTSPAGARVGDLACEPPEDETPTRFTYDPKDPVLTLSSNGSHNYPQVPGLITVGPVDQRPNESRPDVLVYTGEPLEKDVTVIGPVEARLHAATSAKDTDFVVRLIDVYPDGQALNVTEGIVRARYRKSIWEAPSLLTPGQVYEYQIELLPASIVFKKGHRVRIHISSSCWPLWDRNQNTGNPIGMDAEVAVAQQTIYHDREHPSHILLPIAAGELPTNVAIPQAVEKGLRLWLRADAGTTSDSDGRVSAWANQSGSSGHAEQPVETERPILVKDAVNGKPAIRFDGRDDWLKGSVGPLAAPFAILAVCRFAHESQPDGDFDYIISLGAILEAGGHANISRWGTKKKGDPNRNRYYSVFDSPNHVDLVGPVLAGGTYQLISAIHGDEALRHKLYINGAAHEVLDSPSSIRLNGDYTLGKLIHPRVSHPLKGEIAEILVYGAGLSDRDRQAVEAYLTRKYGIR